MNKGLKMQKDLLNLALKKIVQKDLEKKAIDLINSFALKEEQIIKNPNFKLFREWCKEADLYDEGVQAQRRDEYETIFYATKTNWPYKIKKNYYLSAENALKAFFKYYPSYTSKFLAQLNNII